MKISIVYEDHTVFVEYTPEEFEILLTEQIKNGKTVHEALKSIIIDLKKKTLTV